MALAEDGPDLLERPRLRAKRGVASQDGLVVDRRDRLGVAGPGLSDREAHPGLETWPAGFLLLALRLPLGRSQGLELGERLGEVVGERVEVGHRLVVADEAEVDLAVVAHDPEADSLALGERDHRDRGPGARGP